MNQFRNKILVLDDDAHELRKLRELLTKNGFNIITAADKDTALELSRHINFEYVIGRASLLGFVTDEDINKKFR